MASIHLRLRHFESLAYKTRTVPCSDVRIDVIGSTRRYAWIVHLLTVYRITAAIGIAAAQAVLAPHILTAVLYAVAMGSDIIDGPLARILRVESHFGRMLDLAADKLLTLASLFCALTYGVPAVPLVLIAVRDLVMIGSRFISVDRRPLLPTSRLFGGILSCLVWSTTLALLLPGTAITWIKTITYFYWLSSLIATINLAYRLTVSIGRIKAACHSAGVSGASDVNRTDAIHS